MANRKASGSALLVIPEFERASDPAAPPGFDEAAYLRAFPDVREAIEAGERRSALDHYLDCGQHEKRLSDLRYLNASSGGMLEFYGRQDAAECLVFAGWVARSWRSDEAVTLNASFERGSVAGTAMAVLYPRDDLPGDGMGFLAVVATAQRRLGKLTALELQVGDAIARVTPMPDTRELQGKPLADSALALAAACRPGESLSSLTDLVRRRFVGEGYVDSYGYHAPSVGHFICGWVSNEWVAFAKEAGEIVAQFEGGNVNGAHVLNFYEREDLRGRGLGFIAHVATTQRDLGRLLSLSLRAGEAVVLSRPAASAEMLAPETTAANFHALIARSDHGPARNRLRDLIARVAHDGRDTIASLADRVLIEFDDVIGAAPDGLVLVGWMLAHPGRIRAIRLASASQVFPLDLDHNIHWTDRLDVIEASGLQHGFSDPTCGFIAYVPTPGHDGGALHLEVETAAGEVGHKNLPPARLAGIAAIKRLLREIDVQYRDIDSLYDHIFGPAIAALNAQRMAQRPRVSRLVLGPPVQAPRFSVIVPLYGRVDFMEMQMALFANLGLGDDVELIYVLDDPPRTRQTQMLAASLYERFRLPFTLLCLSSNMGFAPANNIGLAAARGTYLCYLNSDVLPASGDWLKRLAERLDADPTLGVVGPVLLFEDGSVQHQGIFFKALPQFANWWFPHHTRKGFRPPAPQGLQRQHAITGAAMLLRREQACRCGGFDEAFVIGDFEDTDLCFKLSQNGLGAAVDLSVTMHHLERKSQTNSGSLWRLNLTLYNAWVHQRRWAAKIASLQEASQEPARL
jgi:GT2 family glycosyltransferase